MLIAGGLLAILLTSPIPLVVALGFYIFSNRQAATIRAAGEEPEGGAGGCLMIVLAGGLVVLLGMMALGGVGVTEQTLNSGNAWLDQTCREVQAMRREKWTGPDAFENFQDCDNVPSNWGR